MLSGTILQVINSLKILHLSRWKKGVKINGKIKENENSGLNENSGKWKKNRRFRKPGGVELDKYNTGKIGLVRHRVLTNRPSHPHPTTARIKD